MVGDGYATVVREWQPGDEVSVEMPMEVRRVAANENVVDDRGKLAIQRGPIMYCLEGVDQPDSTIFDKFIPRDAKFTAVYEPETLNGVMTLVGEASKVLPDGTIEENVAFKAVPYATWNNRGAGLMAVWIPENAETARPEPEPTIASQAMMFSLPTALTSEAPAATSNLHWAWGYNDQWEPKSSADTSKPYHYWWLRRGTSENVCYRFEEPVEISNVDVYWLDFDHYDGNYRVPASWKLYYQDGSQWKEVNAHGEYTCDKDKYNHLDFDPVTTTALRLEAQLQEGESGGVIEWKVG